MIPLPPGAPLFPYTTLFRSLDSLGPDRDAAGGRYLEIRRNLVRLFEWRGCSTPRSEETRLNSSHMSISYAVFCLKKKKYCRRPQAYSSGLISTKAAFELPYM